MYTLFYWGGGGGGEWTLQCYLSFFAQFSRWCRV